MIRKRFCGTVIAALVVVGAVAVVRMLEPDEHTYVDVDRLVRDAATSRGDRVAVRGIVRAASQRRGSADEWQFNLVWRGESLPVRYSGVVPSTFVDGAELVAVGELREPEFRARNVLVRVPR